MRQNTLLFLLFITSGIQAETEDSLVKSYYPASYEESQVAFISACGKLKQAECLAYPLSEDKGQENLAVDTAFIPSSGKKLLIVESGMHGAEAYVGAAAQLLLMDRHLADLNKAGYSVLLIHGINPWGWKHERRADQNNVNLNRNFPHGADFYHNANLDYDKHLKIFQPVGKVGNKLFDQLKIQLAMIGSVAASGFDSKSINYGFDEGQYTHPEGVNFGGNQPAKQTDMLRKILNPRLAGDYETVWFLDFHTGLGPKNVLSVISGIEPPKERLEALKNILVGIKGIEFHTPNDKGFFPTKGDVIDFVPDLEQQKKAHLLALTMEYGTLGEDIQSELQTVSRIVLENQAYHFGCQKPDTCDEVSRDFRQLFNPTDPQWRSSALHQADQVFDAFTRAGN